MARRRHQNPKPFVEGNWWYLRIRRDSFVDGKPVRKLDRVKLAPASTKERVVQKMADEIVRPLNQSLVTVGCAINFAEYVKSVYLLTAFPLLAKTVRSCYEGIIENHLKPAFDGMSLSEITPLRAQAFFSAMPVRGIPYPTTVKIRDAFSSVMRSAVRFRYITENPLRGLELPPDTRGVREKPFIYPHQFEALLELIPEPYASMISVAVWTGLRISELLALKWRNVHEDSISVERRYSRGDWSQTKTRASAATIAVDREVIERIHRLKTLTVDVRAGCAVRHYRVVKADGPDDLVFQCLTDGTKPMNDGNILRRFIKPAAKVLRLENVNWRCLRTSCATWMVRAGADPKSVQGQMRHARMATTMEIYAQIVPEGQRQAVTQVTDWAKRDIAEAGTKPGTASVQ